MDVRIRTHLVAADNAAVGNAKLHQQFFFGVMCNQRNVHNTPPSLLVCLGE